jgi:serine/threonine protein kinase
MNVSSSTKKFQRLKSKIYKNVPSVIIGRGSYGTVYKPPLIPETNVMRTNEIPYICENYIFEQRSKHVGKVFDDEQYCKNENNEMLKMPDEYKELTVKKICNEYSTVIIPKTGALNYQIIYEDGGISLKNIIDNLNSENENFNKENFKKNFKELFYKFAVNILQIMNNKNKYVHFDIKADNILYDGSKLLLIDFGISFQYSDDMADIYDTSAIIYQNYFVYPLELYLIGLIYKYDNIVDLHEKLSIIIDKYIIDREIIIRNEYKYKDDISFSTELKRTKQYLIRYLTPKPNVVGGNSSKKQNDTFVKKSKIVVPLSHTIDSKKKIIDERLTNIYKTIDIFSLGQVYFGMLKVLELECAENDKLDVNRMITLDVNDRMKYFDEIIKPKSPIPGGDSESLFMKEAFNQHIITNLNINKKQMSILHKNRMQHYKEREITLPKRIKALID